MPTVRKIRLQCPFCEKKFKGRTTQDARKKRWVHVFNEHKQLSGGEPDLNPSLN